jgi:hypothetical protein
MKPLLNFFSPDFYITLRVSRLWFPPENMSNFQTFLPVLSIKSLLWSKQNRQRTEKTCQISSRIFICRPINMYEAIIEDIFLNYRPVVYEVGFKC